MSEYSRINKIIKDNYYFNFGSYISQAFDLLFRHFFGFTFFTGILLLTYMFTSVVPVLNLLAFYVLAPILSVGFYIVAQKLQTNKTTSLGDFFLGFEKFQPLALMMLMITSIFIVASIPLSAYLSGTIGPMIEELGLASMDYTEPQDPEVFMEMMASVDIGRIILFFLPLIFVGIIYHFAPMFVYFFQLNPWQAMEASRKVIMKKFFHFLAFSIVISVISAIGLLFFGIGILATYPIFPLALFAAFTDITQLNKDSLENDILDHIVE